MEESLYLVMVGKNYKKSIRNEEITMKQYQEIYTNTIKEFLDNGYVIVPHNILFINVQDVLILQKGKEKLMLAKVKIPLENKLSWISFDKFKLSIFKYNDNSSNQEFKNEIRTVYEFYVYKNKIAVDYEKALKIEETTSKRNAIKFEQKWNPSKEFYVDSLKNVVGFKRSKNIKIKRYKDEYIVESGKKRKVVKFKQVFN